MLNKYITPVVPQKGSLGASGDLVPLAHMALPLIGYGKVNYQDKIYDSKKILNKLNIKIIDLKSKDALSIINGTHFMTAVGVLLINDSYNLIKIADCSGALSTEALNGMIDNFNPKVHELRNHYGQKVTAKIINNLLKKSEYIKKHSDLKAQDAYSIRCIPQVHGASKDAFNYAKGVVNTEINSVTDNPLVFSSNEIISGGNFHGQPLAISFDFLSIALSELCNIAERRIERMVNHDLSKLNPFLIKNSGLNTGFMILQYSAASLVSENKVLSHPASVDSIPSSANQEDHVSMGSIAVRKCMEIKNNLSRVLSIELMCACQAIDLQDKRKLGNGTKTIYDMIRKNSKFVENDRLFYDDINIIEELINNKDFLSNIENKIGKIDF
jgi:histidine ammonia-lyase